MSEWRQIKLSVLLHAINNDHRFLLLDGEALTFHAVKDFPEYHSYKHCIKRIGGLRKCLILPFCYEHRLEIDNDTSMPLYRALGYRTKQSMIRRGYGEFYTATYHCYKRPDEFQGYPGRREIK